MSDTVSNADLAAPSAPLAGRALKASGIFWFLVAAAGQWTFVYYIVFALGGRLVSGDPASVNDTGPIHGFIAGDLMGNLFYITHIALAAVITFGGTLQLVPQLRGRFPAFHRMNGRVFMLCAYVLALGGIYMIWGPRETRLSEIAGLGTSVNGVLIVIAATVALYLAIKRRINDHRKWAMRLFVLVNGVWFYRIGFMGWIVANQGPVGSTRNLDGPFDIFIAFASYLLPLAIMELYLRTSENGTTGQKWLMSGVVSVAALLTGFGIFAAWMIIWSPHL